MKCFKKHYIFQMTVLAVLLGGCSASNESEKGLSENLNETTASEKNVTSDDSIVGTWYPEAVYMDEKLYLIDDNSSLKDLYDTYWINVDADGTFSYQNGPFTQHGDWQKTELKDYEHAFLFTNIKIERLTSKDGEITSNQTESSKEYIAAILKQDNNCMVVVDKGKTEGETSLLIFVKEGQTSPFLQSGKTADESVNDSNRKEDTSTVSTDNTHVSGTATQQAALSTALSYLRYSSFSYDGLIDQLEYEGYSYSDAVYAVDNCGADWNEQALKSAESYLKYSSFSYNGLVGQLEYEGFSHSQAVYAVDNCGADWNEQAVKKAEEYLNYTDMSSSELLDQLEYEGFSYSQAKYGVEHAR